MSAHTDALSVYRFWLAARMLNPGWGPRALKNSLAFVIAGLGERRALGALLRQREHQRLRERIEREPDLLSFLVCPYLHAGWPPVRRFEALSQHQQVLADRLGCLDLPPDGSLVLADLRAFSPGARLVLDRAPWFVREGGLVLSLFADSERLMSVAFSFGRIGGDVVAYVGGMQGSNSKTARDEYRQLTKAFHGLRPRDFLVKALQLLLGSVGVTCVLCIADENRQHRHPFFGRRKAADLHLNYDEIWRTHGGQRTEDGFFKLSVVPAVKPLAEVPSNKRAMYKRRRAMLAELARDLEARGFRTKHLGRAGRRFSQTGQSTADPR